LKYDTTTLQWFLNSPQLCMSLVSSSSFSFLLSSALFAPLLPPHFLLFCRFFPLQFRLWGREKGAVLFCFGVRSFQFKCVASLFFSLVDFLLNFLLTWDSLTDYFNSFWRLYSSLPPHFLLTSSSWNCLPTPIPIHFCLDSMNVFVCLHDFFCM
jgi:hypothetical protein